MLGVPHTLGLLSSPPQQPSGCSAPGGPQLPLPGPLRLRHTGRLNVALTKPFSLQLFMAQFPQPLSHPTTAFFHLHLFVYLFGHAMRHEGFPGGDSGKGPACQCRRHKRHGFDPWVGKIPWREAWQPTPVFLPGESHGQRSWQVTVHGVAKSWARLKRLSTHTCMQYDFLYQSQNPHPLLYEWS